MNLNNPNRELIQLEDIILETASVAMIRQDVAEISKQNDLVFEESFDDLDFLVYATLSFAYPNSRVSLICRRNSPVSGIEICVKHDEQHKNVALLVCKTLQKLSLSVEDLIWIHPNYQEEVYKLVERVQIGFENANNEASSKPKQFGGWVTYIIVDGKKYTGEGKTEAESVVAAQAAVKASNRLSVNQ